MIDNNFSFNKTFQSRIIFSSHLNDNKTLFGGKVVAWMDEIAYITAKRISNNKLTTIKINNLQFRLPVFEGEIIYIVGNVIKKTNTKLYINVSVYKDSIDTTKRVTAIEGVFEFCAINENYLPVRINYLS